MLSVHQGNRLECLADRLIDSLAKADDAPLEARLVVVPSSAMARWLKLRIASRLGICTQVDFPYPAELIWRLFASVLPGIGQDSPFDREIMTWRLHGLLGRLPARDEFAALRRWLAAGDARNRLELALSLAELFDQYLVYRPDWLACWDAERLLGLDGHAVEPWQAWLWRELRAASGGPGAHPKEAFFAALAHDRQARARLPGRLTVFGIPLLPPIYGEILSRLAEYIDITLFVPNPCREYWADIVPARDLARLALRGESAVAYRDIGQALLAAWGKQAREQLTLLCGLADAEHTRGSEEFVRPEGDDLLSRVQAAIVDLDDPPDGSISEVTGDSLTIHACHGLARQIEVLHDRLLAQFDRLPGLQPGDVVVMTPDIDAASALIDGIFGSMPSARHIPYVITGRRRSQAGGLIAALRALLEIPGSRFEVTRLVDLLAMPAVARRFQLDAADLETLREWLHAAGLRWGLDAHHRASLGLPAEPRHSWADALAKLLMGYALSDGAPGDEFAGAVPGVEGQVVQALGKLLRFASVVVDFARAAQRPRPIVDWVELLARVLRALTDAGESDEAASLQLRHALAGLAHAVDVAPNHEMLPYDVFRDALTARLAASAPGAAPSGAVTFCGIGPLRGIPYRVVAMLGMDDGQFPRRANALEFDLMARHPRLGDRARHEDDRGAFLDALLAAREAFIVTYCGRDVGDNSARAPALPVAELVEYLELKLAGGAAALADKVCFEHPLQAFSPRNFDAAGPRSYAGEFLPAARILAGTSPRAPSSGLLIGIAELPVMDQRVIDRDTVAEFLRHPLRYFLTRRLGIELAPVEEELEAEEPFEVDALDRHILVTRMLPAAIAGDSAQSLSRELQVAAGLPHGSVGELLCDELVKRVLHIAGRIRAATQDAKPRSLPVTWEIGQYTVTASIGGIYPAGRVVWRPGRVAGADVATAWLDHLVYRLGAPDHVGVSRLIAEDMALTIRGPQDPAAALLQLIELFADGHRRPLALPMRSALVAKKQTRNAALATWQGSEQQPGECDDKWWRLAYGEAQLDLPAGFDEAVEALFGPMWHCLEFGEPAAGGA